MQSGGGGGTKLLQFNKAGGPISFWPKPGSSVLFCVRHYFFAKHVSSQLYQKQKKLWTKVPKQPFYRLFESALKNLWTNRGQYFELCNFAAFVEAKREYPFLKQKDLP